MVRLSRKFNMIRISDQELEEMVVDKDKVRQKLHFMRDSLRLLRKLASGPELLKSDGIYIDAAVRRLQIVIEALLDICAHIISRKGWGLPKTYRETISIAANLEVSR